jgi:hypothetical protein
MLFKLLKLFGFDVAAEFEAAKSGFERRVERATEHIKDVAQGAAVIATLGALATVTAMMAFIIGLIAVYRFTAQFYGDYAGLGIDAAILIMMTTVFVIVILMKVQKLSTKETTAPMTDSAFESVKRGSSPSDQAVEGPVSSQSAYLAPERELAAPRDLIDPLALVLSEVVRVPTFGNPMVDDLIGKIRTTAESNADETIYRAANVIRYGGLSDILIVLSGTAALAWLVTRNAQRQPPRSAAA